MAPSRASSAAGEAAGQWTLFTWKTQQKEHFCSSLHKEWPSRPRVFVCMIHVGHSRVLEHLRVLSTERAYMPL